MVFRQDLRRVQIVEAALKETFFSIWGDAVKLSANDLDGKCFLIGALDFSAVWHNRWSISENRDEDLDRWWRALQSEVEMCQGTSYWTGIQFNIDYHARYFFEKADAWARESSINRWKRKQPRLGADALYESGLASSELDKKTVSRHSKFLIECLDKAVLDYAVQKDQEDSARPYLNMESAIFVFGMRMQNDRTLKEVLSKHIAASFKWSNREMKRQLWSGISMLYLHSFKNVVITVREVLKTISHTNHPELIAEIVRIVDDLPSQKKSLELLKEFRPGSRG
jgi:hypothetical protein